MKHSWYIMLAGNLLAALLKVIFVLHGSLNLFSEEAQYWLWSHHIDWSYYSKPPLVAYTNWLSTHVFGSTELGVRINAIYYFWKVLQTDKVRDWIVLGVACGLGFLSKYSMPAENIP